MQLVNCLSLQVLTPRTVDNKRTGKQTKKKPQEIHKCIFIENHFQHGSNTTPFLLVLDALFAYHYFHQLPQPKG
ncbi:hypothetical protein STEG23_028997, partial [Scotinomys teguina]